MKRKKLIYAMKRVKIITEVLAIAVIFNGICIGLRYLYTEEFEPSRVLWHDYYNQEENIDNLYLGSSHVFQFINLFLMDDLNGNNNFCLATGSQSMKGSYYCLKEAARDNQLSHVYLEMFYFLHVGSRGDYNSKEGVLCNWKCTDYMKPSLNSLEFIISMRDTNYFGDTIFPFLRYRNYLFDSDWIQRMITRKRTEDYKNYQYSNALNRYEGKGYLNGTREMTEAELCYKRDSFSSAMCMTEEAESYLRRIIEYCQTENIELTLFSSPIYDLRLVSTGNYDEYVNQIRAIAEEYDTVEYFDFNLCRPEYWQTTNLELYFDESHLNISGAEKFTKLFYQVMSCMPEENDKYFYSSYVDKLASTEPEVYGLYYDEKTYIASNRNIGLEYRVIKIPEEKEKVMIQDFSENKEFYLPEDEDGICIIEWRETGKIEINSLQINY